LGKKALGKQHILSGIRRLSLQKNPAFGNSGSNGNARKRVSLRLSPLLGKAPPLSGKDNQGSQFP
jgi:hypothetical protein